MKKDNIIVQIERINQQILLLSDREYNPEMSASEQREISKRKKKLNVNLKKKRKRKKKLNVNVKKKRKK